MKGIAQTSSSAANQVRRLEGGAGTPLRAATASRQERRLKIPTCLERNPSFGNRTSTKAGGDQNGQNLRPASYSVNNANQYSSRGIPSAFDVVGIANPSASVTVNSAAVDYRRREYFRKEVAVANSSVPVWQSVAVATSGGGSSSGNVFVPKTAETFVYDEDANLKSDGRWTYTWDAENRMTNMVVNTTNGPQQNIDYEYDWMGRRIGKKVWNNTSRSGNPATNRRFLYNGWNLIAEVDGNNNNALVHAYVWGLDLSGSLQGAGGVGELLMVKDAGQGTHFAAYDLNGNVAGLRAWITSCICLMNKQMQNNGVKLWIERWTRSSAHNFFEAFVAVAILMAT